jgi:hypothetical protein
MDTPTLERMSGNARSFGRQIASTDTDRENRELFRSILPTLSFEGAR